MSFVVLLPDGFEVLTTNQGRDSYEPLLGTSPEQDLSAFWEMVPDDLHELSSTERKLVEAMWSGLVQYASSLLNQAAHLDQTGSLFDFPIHLPRKWLHFDIERTYELNTERAELLDNTQKIQESRVLEIETESGFHNAFDFYGTGGRSFAGIELRSASSYDTQYRFEVEFQMTASLLGESDRGWVLLGYSNQAQRHASRFSGFMVALSTAGDVGILCVSGGTTGFQGALTSPQVTYYPAGSTLNTVPGNRLRVSLWYDGSVGGLDSTQGARVTLLVEDLDLGTELRVDNRRIDFTSADDVLGGTFLDGWWGDSFGFMAPPFDVARYVPEIGTGDYTVRILPGATAFVDPSVDGRIRQVPLLQPQVSNDQEFLRAGLEFDLARDSNGGWAYLRFEDQPARRLWAEAAALDGQLLSKLFGPLTGIADLLEQSDGLKLKTQIIGALYGLISGPHLGPLAAAIGGLLGAPIAIRPGVVIDTTSMGGQPAIVVQEVDRERVYPYPAGLERTVEVGDVIEKFTPLVTLPFVHDWITAPVRLADAVEHEIQKYSRVLTDVQVEYLMAEFNALPRPLTATIIRLFSHRFSERIRRYLVNAMGVWCGLTDVLINILVRTSEELGMSDRMVFSGRRDHYLATITALPAAPAGTPEYDADPVQIGDKVDLVLVNTLKLAFDRDAKPGFAFDFIEFDTLTFPRDRTQLNVYEALTGGPAPRYNDGEEYLAEPADPDACPPADLLYNLGEVWVLDTRADITATYSGPDVGPQTLTIYRQTVTLAQGESFTFREPNYWDECGESLVNLDFSMPRNSHHLPWL